MICLTLIVLSKACGVDCLIEECCYRNSSVEVNLGCYKINKFHVYMRFTLYLLEPLRIKVNSLRELKC